LVEINLDHERLLLHVDRSDQLPERKLLGVAKVLIVRHVDLVVGLSYLLSEFQNTDFDLCL